MLQARHFRSAAIAATVAAIYFTAGKLGLRLALVHPSATAVWPPTGIALAAFLIFGYRVWPGVLLGAFLVNITTAGNVATSIGIAAGNTLEGLVGSYLVHRFARGTRAFEQPQDIFKFAVLAGLVSTAVSASIGVTSLALAGFAPWSSYPTVWLTWWLGDAAGALIVAPFLVLWSNDPRISWRGRRLAEVGLLLVSVILVGSFVFGARSPAAARNYPIAFLCFPVLTWAAFRMTQREAATATTLLSAIAIAGTVRGFGPFVHDGPSLSLLLLQGFLAVTSVMFLAAAAAVAGRNRDEARIRLFNEELEAKILGRTEQLWMTNQELRNQILERTRAQEELEKSEARLREAQHVARMGSWEWDIEKNIVWWSDELYSIYGLERDSFGASYEAFLECVHPEDRDRVRRCVEAAYQNNQPLDFEHRIVRPDGSVVLVHARGRVLTDEQGKAVRMLGTGQDITEHRQIEEERARLIQEQAARREAEEANRMKDEFLATLSHELRNPLNAVVGWAHLLREGQLDPETAAKAVETISRNAEVQGHLISDILDISRITLGRLDLKMQPVFLASIIESALETMSPSAQAKSIQLHANVKPVAKPVLGDPDRLQQVVWNLLSNAIKFAPGDGQVTISLVGDDSEARIQVEDNGPGIDPEFIPHIFERFRQHDHSTPRKHKGLGLGLAIVRRLVELHRGTVSAKNREDGPGAVFTVILPLAEAPLGRAAQRATPPTRVEAIKEEPVPAGNPLQGIRMLVVEDDPDSRKLITTLMSRCGAEVKAVSSCSEALAAFQTHQPDVLVSDIEMPGENGFDLITKVRSLSSSNGGSIPAIALTAYAGDEHAHRAVGAGYHAHVAKPVRLVELVRIVTELTRGVVTSDLLVPRPDEHPER